jgi:hypothetical protein
VNFKSSIRLLINSRNNFFVISFVVCLAVSRSAYSFTTGLVYFLLFKLLFFPRFGALPVAAKHHSGALLNAYFPFALSQPRKFHKPLNSALALRLSQNR